jgi:hypothetical protein
MLFCKCSAWCDLLKSHQFESLTLETAKDLTHQPALDTVGLDGDERAFGCH